MWNLFMLLKSLILLKTIHEKTGNIVSKGVNAGNHFCLFLQIVFYSFKHKSFRLYLIGLLEIHCLALYHTILTFNDPETKKTFLNILGKGENAGNQHFLLFPQCFQPIPKRISAFNLHLFCCLQML